MTRSVIVKTYSPREEMLNIFSHAFGLLLSLFATVLLVLQALNSDSAIHLISFTVFGLSLVALYAASTYYHSAKDPLLRSKLRVVDHSAIYILIAGTYTPFMLITLAGKLGWVIFAVTWGLAAMGITLKIFFTGRFTLLSTLMYVFMGWLIVFAIKPLAASLAPEGLQWLIAGGLAYTLGAVLYGVKKLPFNHAIFHIFVLLGSVCHFVAVYRFV